LKRSSFEYIIPAVLALVITVGLIRLIPELSTKHLLRVDRMENVPPENFLYYFDLNGDGTSEIFSIFLNSSNNLAVSISDIHQSTINQFNLPGSLTRQGAALDLHDIDGNGITDIFVCTEKGNTLYLSIIDDLYGHPTTTKEYVIDPINRLNDNGDYLFVPGTITDLNQDGSPEYVFAINGGFALQPRRVYAIDFLNDTVWKSPLSGAAVVSLDFFDLDRDGKDEILINAVAPENFKISIPYRDSISWMMVLDDDLSFYKPPVAMNKPPSWFSMEPFVFNGENYLMTYHRFREEEDYNAILAIYDDSLNLVKKRIFTGQSHSRYYLWRVPDSLRLDAIKLLSNSGIYTVDFNLQETDSILNHEPFGYNDEVRLDADGDGQEEYVFTGNYNINVFRADMTESASLNLQWNTRAPRTLISVIQNPGTYPLVCAQIGTERFYLRYFQNGWYHYREVVYPGICLVLFGIFYLMGLLQTRLVAGRYEKDRLINQLQLQSIKNQLDPHFTYNALNAVGSLIYKGEKDLAYQYLKGLADLLRMVSGEASEVTWALSSELDFVYKFLDIEKLRFREKFNYTVEVEKGLEDFMMPKMSVLTFVENAIKHGLRHREYDRQLEVKAIHLESGMMIQIRDNGIGRAAASKFRDETQGRGIKIMKQYFRQFNEATGKKARFEIRDLFEYDLKPAGTLVEIYIS
jgi:hypothetical protein